MHLFLKFIFGIKFYMFWTVPLSIIRSFHSTHSSSICQTGLLTACEQDQDGFILILLARCQQTCVTYHCCVYGEKTPDDGQRNCPKHVEFKSKNKFEKIVHQVDFIIRIYHDSPSPERQTVTSIVSYNSDYLVRWFWSEKHSERHPRCCVQLLALYAFSLCGHLEGGILCN